MNNITTTTETEAHASMVNAIARVCHQTNKAYCESMGDHSQREWEHAPEWQRESARNGVRFHLASPDSKPEDSHNNWLKEKLEQGWKHGPVKNAETKEHPCCVAYNELPAEQQAKDKLFIGVVRAMTPVLVGTKEAKTAEVESAHDVT